MAWKYWSERGAVYVSALRSTGPSWGGARAIDNLYEEDTMGSAHITNY